MINEDNIKKRQATVEEKAALLIELGLSEASLIYVNDQSPPTGSAPLSKEYGCRSFDRCSVNECPLNLLTFGREGEKVILFRKGQPGDPQRTCHIDRQTRERYYNELDPQFQALIPNKALQIREIREDERIAAMSGPERAAYLRKKEELRQRWVSRFTANRKA